MSDTSQGPGWWQASDGKFYPPETHPVTGNQGTAASTPQQPTTPTPTPMTPDVGTPSVPDGSAGFPGPSSSDLGASAPTFDPSASAPGAPQINTPDMPGAPEINTPSMPGTPAMPGAPEINTPSMPGTPQINTPGTPSMPDAGSIGTPPNPGGFQAAAPAAAAGAVGAGAVGAAGYQAAPSYQAVEPPKKKGGMLKKVLIGLLLLGLLLIGGCIALGALIVNSEDLQNRLTGMVFTTPVTQCGADADGNLEAVGTISAVEGADIEGDDIPVKVKFMDGDEVIAEATTKVAGVSGTPTEFMVETPGTATATMTCVANVDING